MELRFKGLNVFIFTGTFENKVDAKGRVSIPAAFRALIQNSKSGELALFPSFRFACLEAMSFDFLGALSRQSGSKVDLFTKGTVNPLSILFRSTHRLHIDDAGRITLPEALIAQAGLSKTAVFTGGGHSFMLWSPEAYAQQAADDRAYVDQEIKAGDVEFDFAAAAMEVMG